MKATPIMGAIALGYAGEIFFLKKLNSGLTGSDIVILGISHGLAIAVTLYVRYLSNQEYLEMESKFTSYLEELDRKNHRLYTQNIKLKVKLQKVQKSQKRV